MKADIRHGIGSVYLVIKAEDPIERALLAMVSERRDWEIDAKTLLPLRTVLEATEISLFPKIPLVVER